VAASTAIVRINAAFTKAAGAAVMVSHQIRLEGSKTSGARVRLLVDADGHIDTLTVPEPDSLGSIHSRISVEHRLAMPADGFTLVYMLLAERDTKEDDANVSIESDDITVRRLTDSEAKQAK
jgi:hypothetical protein